MPGEPPGRPPASWLYLAVAGLVLTATSPLHAWQQWRDRRARSRAARRERTVRLRVEHEQRCGGLGHLGHHFDTETRKEGGQ